jgi:hypothetical protein
VGFPTDEPFFGWSVGPGKMLVLPHQTNANLRGLTAGLVAWTGAPWPHLAVATVIAGLFLQSSWSIIADARSELRTSTN